MLEATSAPGCDTLARMKIWARFKARRRRRKIIAARTQQIAEQVREYPRPYPDGSVDLPAGDLVLTPCAACGEPLLAAPDEESPMHGAGCPVRPWRVGDMPRTWEGGHGHGL
jgi:hypothetical protein